jgi:hypothetical protein
MTRKDLSFKKGGARRATLWVLLLEETSFSKRGEDAVLFKVALVAAASPTMLFFSWKSGPGIVAVKRTKTEVVAMVKSSNIQKSTRALARWCSPPL